MNKLFLVGLVLMLLLVPVMGEEHREETQNLEAYSDVEIVADYYEPAVITSSVLEEQNSKGIPIYVVLKGIKLNPQVEDIRVENVIAFIKEVRTVPPTSDPGAYVKGGIGGRV